MTPAPAAPRLLHIGCYTDGAGGDASGLDVLMHDPVTGVWTVPPGRPDSDGAPESPSFLAWHPDGRHLYAVGEVEAGRLLAYEIDPDGGRPRLVGSASTGGAFPCHLSIDPGGRWVVSANYGSGSLAVHEILPDGSIGRRSTLLHHSGAGPDLERQRGPHAHMATFVTETLLLAVDLGADGVAAYRLDATTGALGLVSWSSLPAGFGPRHLVLLPDDRIALAGELSAEIALLKMNVASGRLTLLDVQSASRRPGANDPSGIGATTDGRYVLIANRGPDTVSAFGVLSTAIGNRVPAGLAAPPLGALRRADEIDCGGGHPRAITVIDELVYVANQHGSNITVLRIDERTGGLSDTGSRISTPTPTHVLPPAPLDPAVRQPR